MLLAILLACGGGGGGSGSGPAVEGQLLVPPEASPLTASMRVGGTVPMEGATVELIRVNSRGGTSGPALGSDVTDSFGRFSIPLPDGVSPGMDLIVRVRGGRAHNLRALVLERETDIDPGSEYLFRRITAEDFRLTDVTPSEARAIRTILAEYDIGDATSVTDAIVNLGQQANREIEALVDAAVEPAGDATALAGGYHFLQFAAEVGSTPGVRHVVQNGSLTVVDGGGGEGSVTNLVLDGLVAWYGAASNGSGGADYTLDTAPADSSGDPPLPFQLASNGDLLVLDPPEEDLTDGTRESASLLHLAACSDAPGNGAYAGVFASDTRVHATVDGELDRGSILGRSLLFSFALVGCEEAVAHALIDGRTYGYVALAERFDETGGRVASAQAGTFTPAMADNASGTATLSSDAVSLVRAAQPDSLAAQVAWSATGAGGADDPVGAGQVDEAVDYTLDTVTGAFSIANLPAGEERRGFVANGGGLVALGLRRAGAGDAENGVLVGVRLGAANPAVSGQEYRVIALTRGYGTDGRTTVTSLKNRDMTFSGSSVVWAKPVETARQDDDLADSIARESGSETDTGTITFDASDGRATMAIDGAKLKGFFNEDGSLGVFRFAHSDFAGDGEGTAGILVLVRK